MKPLLLGMNNPLSDDPEFDLYPYPEGSTGWRLWKMMPEGTTRGQYLGAFERRNLIRARKWDARAARAVGSELVSELGGRYVVVLGTQVRAALGLPRVEPLMTWDVAGVDVAADGARTEYRWTGLAMPHPSGLNRWYNDPANYAAARARLAELAGAGAVDW